MTVSSRPVPADARPCLVLVPGLACDAAVWQPLLDGLAAQAQAWVPPPMVCDSIGEMAQALLRDAPAERFLLAGHSLGGRIALEVMRRAPQRVQGLALLDTGCQALPAGDAGRSERAHRQELVALAKTSGMRAMGERWSRPMLHPSCLGTPVHEEVLAMIERQSVARFAAQQQALLARPDATAVLDTVNCPALLLCGREDGWSPPARHEDMAARIPGARLVVVADCGHMSPMEKPADVGRALRDLIASA